MWSGRARRASGAGFTIVEMLVVMVVIVILASLLIPTVARSKEKARCAKCAAHLKQFHAALIVAASESTSLGSIPSAVSCQSYDAINKVWSQCCRGWVDFDGPVVPSGSYNAKLTPWNGTNTWSSIKNGSIWAYTGNMSLYLCPSFNMMARSANPSCTNAYRSYGMNVLVSGKAFLDYGKTARDTAARTLLMGDIGYDVNMIDAGEWTKAGAANNSCYWALRSDTGDDDSNTVKQHCRYRRSNDGMLEGTKVSGVLLERLGAFHDGLANCLFMDGHVEKISWTNTEAVCNGTWLVVD